MMMVINNDLFKINPQQVPHITLVISPLKSLMLNQVARWSTVNWLKPVAILNQKEMTDEQVNGEISRSTHNIRQFMV